MITQKRGMPLVIVASTKYPTFPAKPDFRFLVAKYMILSVVAETFPENHEKVSCGNQALTVRIGLFSNEWKIKL